MKVHSFERFRVLRFQSAAFLLIVSLSNSLALGQMDQAFDGPMARDILRAKGIDSEIALTPDQHRAIKRIVVEFNNSLVCIETDLQVLTQSNPTSDPVHVSTTRDQMYTKLSQELSQELANVLLPHQTERLYELIWWSAINSGMGMAETLGQDPFRTSLSLEARDVATIVAEAKRLQSQFEVELMALRTEYRNKLLEELTDDQKRKLTDALGKESNLGLSIPKF